MPNTNSNLSTTQSTKLTSPFKWGDSYTSLLLGILVVFLAGVAFVLFAQIHRGQMQAPKLRQEITAAHTVRTPSQVAMEAKTKPTTYVVQEGDDLWDISVKEYNSGYKWGEIAKANNLSNPSLLFKGQVLTIPQSQTIAQAIPTKTLPTNIPTVTHKVLPTAIAAKTTPAPQQNINAPNGTITGDSYVVQHGDNLWNVAVRAYNDGYKWPLIARENNLSNPGLIHSGNVLKLPRGNNS